MRVGLARPVNKLRPLTAANFITVKFGSKTLGLVNDLIIAAARAQAPKFSYEHEACRSNSLTSVIPINFMCRINIV